MIALLIVMLVIIGCAVYQFLKGTIVQAFATIVVTICASIIAFGYFEFLAKFFLGYIPSLGSWAQALSFLLLFILCFAILQTVVAQLTRHPIDFGFLPERIGRVVCGIFLGLYISGVIITILAIAPLPNKYPYQRFDERHPDAQRPNKVFLNADGFVTGFFGILSNGSFSAISNKRSFACLHPNFLDQIFLNRHSISNGVSILTSTEAIEVPPKNGLWYAPDNIRDSEDKPLPSKSGHSLIITRVGINRGAAKDAGVFTLSQLRLVCKLKTSDKNPLAGRGKNVYPIGYLTSAKNVQIKRLDDQIRLGADDFKDRVGWIDFAFHVPNDFVPVLVEFKLNNIVQVQPPVPAEQAPQVEPFGEKSEIRQDIKEPDKDIQEPAEGVPSSSKGTKVPSKKKGLSDFSRGIIGDQLEEE
jgi:hypothetical protein